MNDESNNDPGPMKTKEVIENLFAAAVIGILCGVCPLFLHGILEGVGVAAIVTLYFVACAGVHWAAVNVAWEIRSRSMRNKYM